MATQSAMEIDGKMLACGLCSLSLMAGAFVYFDLNQIADEEDIQKLTNRQWTGVVAIGGFFWLFILFVLRSQYLQSKAAKAVESSQPEKTSKKTQ